VDKQVKCWPLQGTPPWQFYIASRWAQLTHSTLSASLSWRDSSPWFTLVAVSQESYHCDAWIKDTFLNIRDLTAVRIQQTEGTSAECKYTSVKHSSIGVVVLFKSPSTKPLLSCKHFDKQEMDRRELLFSILCEGPRVFFCAGSYPYIFQFLCAMISI
jgi:hypothetical protein